jgi:hypothetical protein
MQAHDVKLLFITATFATTRHLHTHTPPHTHTHTYTHTHTHLHTHTHSHTHAHNTHTAHASTGCGAAVHLLPHHASIQRRSGAAGDGDRVHRGSLTFEPSTSSLCASSEAFPFADQVCTILCSTILYTHTRECTCTCTYTHMCTSVMHRMVCKPEDTYFL